MFDSELKEKPVGMRLRNLCFFANVWVSRLATCTVFLMVGFIVTSLYHAVTPSQMVGDLGATFLFPTANPEFELKGELAVAEVEKPPERVAKPKRAAHEAALPSEEGQFDRSSLEIDVDRRDLEDWVNVGASLEEVRFLEEFREWLSRTPRSAVQKALTDMQKGEEWNNCAQEGEVCDCMSGIFRYGNPEAAVWTQLEKDTGALKCNTGSFGKDPKKGSVKICQCKGIVCPDGSLADLTRCPANDRRCKAACGYDWRPRRSGPKVPRQALCTGDVSHELLWGCDSKESRNPKPGSAHQEWQDILDKSIQDFCAVPKLKNQFDTFLDCRFARNYLEHTTDESEWLEEAYVTYIGGPKGSKHELMITNLIRSVQAFSKLPLVLVIVDDIYEPPPFWREFSCLIVYKMQGRIEGLPFNVNKARAMIGSRVGTGAELDGDQIIFAGMDEMFEPTRREVTAQYPFPVLPVHWGAREEGWNRYTGPRSMRWNHAHPTWTHWAIPFCVNLLYMRVAALVIPEQEISLWKFSANSDTDIRTVLANGVKEKRKAVVDKWMVSDEPMMNVLLWMAGATKAWCKFDLEPSLYAKGTNIKATMYADKRWYPDGLPLIFYSMHNTKNPKETDLLVTLLIYCTRPDIRARMKCTPNMQCSEKLDTLAGRIGRVETPEEYTIKGCCCVDPRVEHPFFWQGKWYKESEDVPDRSASGSRLCLLP
mmetsp:Transcript_70532/g.168952  ORF Transcript_70532/g.168952 Transcript_70532/m.168952 type:complete len:708 (+) Transcript_70532:113-2236(+)